MTDTTRPATPSPSWWTMRPASSLRSPACSPARATTSNPSPSARRTTRPSPASPSRCSPTRTMIPARHEPAVASSSPVHSVQHPLRRAFHPAGAGPRARCKADSRRRAQRGHPDGKHLPRLHHRCVDSVLDRSPSSVTRQRAEALMHAAAWSSAFWSLSAPASSPSSAASTLSATSGRKPPNSISAKV